MDSKRTRVTDLMTKNTKHIISLHKIVLASLKLSLTNAFKIGELLIIQKKQLKHGQFGKWIDSNLPFTDRTARNYIKLYQHRDRLKTENVSDLKTAYRLLRNPVVKELYDPGEEHHLPSFTACYACCVNQYREDVGNWKDALKCVAKESGFPFNVLLMWHMAHHGIVDDGLILYPYDENQRQAVEDNIMRIYEEEKTKTELIQ